MSGGAKEYVLTVAEMEEKFGPYPSARSPCSVCDAGSGEQHKDDCPWLIWANSPIPGRPS